MAPMASETVGRRIRLRRQALGMSQQELAERLGADRATVSAWERGRHWPVRFEGALVEILGISLSDEEEPVTPDLTNPAERAIWAMDTYSEAERRQIIRLVREDRRRAKTG